MPALAADVVLKWDASVSPGITGYKVHYGRSSRNYGEPIAVGNQTTYTVRDLANGKWYFSVTAIDGKGNESGFSNEVVKIVGPTTTQKSPVPCDINGDGVVNRNDLQALNDVILNKSSAASHHDLNKDGTVNALDLQILTNILLGSGTCP